MKNTAIPVRDSDALGSVRDFLRQLMESKVVDVLLVPRMLPTADGFVQALVEDQAALADANPFSPTMPVQSARILSELTATSADIRIGAVLKPCEVRATVELAKFLQVSFENLVTIGVDCPGTVGVKEYAALDETARGQVAQSIMAGAADGAVRECCRTCDHPSPTGTDLTLGVFGADTSQAVTLLVGETVENELSDKLSLELKEGEPAGRAEALVQVRSQRQETRDSVYADLKVKADGLDKFMDIMSTCVRCHNCMNACPICYCKECVFESPVFEPRADQIVDRAKRKGSLRMPGDTLIFHLTRMAHMGTSCVSCGMCSSACPSGLPVSNLFGLMGSELQEMFDYVPGRNVEEEPPVAVFKEDELQTVSEG